MLGPHLVALKIYSWLCVQGSLLAMLWVSYIVTEIKAGLKTCNATNYLDPSNTSLALLTSKILKWREI